MNRQAIVFIEVTPYEVRFLRPKRGRIGPGDFLVQPLPHGQEKQLENVLREYRQSLSGVKKMAAYLLIPFENGLLREYKLPWMAKKDRDSGIRYNLEYEMPYLWDDLVFQYQVTEEKKGERLHILVTACRKERLGFYTRCLTQAGYAVQGIEYSAWALGEAFRVQDHEAVLCLRKSGQGKAEAILYKGSVPQAIREIELKEMEESSDRFLSAADFRLSVADSRLSAHYLLTDNSPEAKAALDFLVGKGLMEGNLPAPPLHEELADLPELAAFAPQGERLRVRSGKNLNFYQKSHSARNKLTLVFSGACLVLLLAATGAAYMQGLQERQKLEEEIAFLTEQSEALGQQIGSGALHDWEVRREAAVKDLQQLTLALQAFSKTEEVDVSRWHYLQGKLDVQAESSNNQAIMDLMAKLTADGWKQPVLHNYRLRDQRIEFTLSVSR